MSDYTVKKGALGTVVQYECPQCKSPLTSNVSEAGGQDTCPDCGCVFVIPGEAEKLELERRAALKQRAKIEEQQRKNHEAEDAKRRKEQRRKAKEEAAALAAVSTSPPVVAQSVNSPPSGAFLKQKREFGDGILEFSFSVARGFSVVTIVLFSILLVIALLGAVFVQIGKRKVNAPQVVAPTKAEYDSYKASSPDNSENDTSYYTDEGDGNDVLSQIATEYHLDSFAVSMLVSASESLEQSEMKEFTSGLKLLLDADNSTSKRSAAIWYAMEYAERKRAREIDLSLDRTNNQFWNRATFLLVMGSLYLFIALMSFIAFPLLIRIERNTRSVASVPQA
ncbi:hypothetical protein NG895_05205 [Aeoliella sp. ICT_H6.2]|uniref:Uncharacterized protein n=1 Tax=Aeoliella straminimaris TaxID=2954799 RepID=A0A9X2F822_9BACT|nr:zf-TFIIB domain-containing protein [Aeoliella straminimaris]MCO6043297.1 hypothetical protein [Aeoliella straminimaris]